MPARPRKAATARPAFASLLASAKLPERTVPICLRGDLVAEHEAADRELAKLLERPVEKFGGDGRGQVQQRIRDLEEQMGASTHDFRLRALSRAAWHVFIAEHPPRHEPNGEVNPADAAIGIDTSTFFEALIRQSLIDPELDAAGWQQLFEVLTDRQFDSLSDAAWGLNRRDVDVPFSPAAWRASQISEPE